ncbi:hypothetical protein [Umezawaea sp. NPDC059074]|uniref:sunset domain-containing protein n=1 Tax=Umezawaea sp. NPDC059074 TaxID=3346716 RepID=UPI00367D4DC9
MVSLFGQVWLWSLLSFVAGVLVTWLVQVRPAKQRLAELEANRLSAPAGPPRPQPQAPPSPVSSPMRDEEFDDWHVGARATSDPALAPPPEQVWPQSPAQEAPRAYEPPRAAEPYEPPSRSGEPLRPLEPQRLVEPPRPQEPYGQEPYAPLPRTPEPRQSNDVAPFPPLSAFAAAPEPEPEPDSDNYDELPPALTRIPEDAEPSRIVEPVDVPEEEKPRSLFQRLSTEDEVQAEPVPLNPAQEPTVFRRADLDELPDVPEIPADRTRYLNPVTAEVAPAQEEPTAPPEVQEWHPREMWREEEEAQLEVDRPTEAEQDAERPEAELLDDREEDFAADDVLPAEAEVEADAEVAEPVEEAEEAEVVDETPEDETETTSVIPAGEVQRAIDAADARAEAEREAESDAERQPWPEHSLTGQFPIAAVTDAIESSKGQLGVQPDDPDDRRDDPDEVTAAAEPQDTEDTRDAETRGADFRAAQAAPTESRGWAPAGGTPVAPFSGERASTAPFQAEQPAAKAAEPEAPATEFFPAELPPIVDKRAAAPRAADFFAPQPVEPEAPAPKAAKPAPAQPAAERPRSLFEPIVGASDDDPEPAETVRHLPPSDDQPFVPTLAPELLQRGSNGLPQRPQRPAGGPPPMTSPPLLGPPQPVAPPQAKPLPVRPRPVGFSPSTGGRSEPSAPVAPRYQQPEGFNPRSPFGPGSVLPKSDGHAPAADFEVKATLTGRRYFRPGTSSFDDTRADVWFRTEADAQKAGFRPA